VALFVSWLLIDLPLMIKRKPEYFNWLVVDLVLLLVWSTKWPQFQIPPQPLLGQRTRRRIVERQHGGMKAEVIANVFGSDTDTRTSDSVCAADVRMTI
jgi:hypothetical protein